MPCGQPCKEILDGVRRLRSKLDESLGCMENSILLDIINGGEGPPAAMLNSLRQKADSLALAAQDIATFLGERDFSNIKRTGPDPAGGADA